MRIVAKKTFSPFLLAIIPVVLLGWTSMPVKESTVHVNYPPVSTFESSCARCHGPEGAFYGDSFGRLPDEELEKFVTDMMKGPAGLDPNPMDIDAMVAYNQSLTKKKPFIFLSSIDTTDVGIIFSGECTPGISLIINCDNVSQNIEVGGEGKWETKPIDPSCTPVFTAKNTTGLATLVYGDSRWTN